MVLFACNAACVALHIVTGSTIMAATPIYAYLGPKGTFSHEAMRTFAQREENGFEELECGSIEEVFEMVDRGRATYGVAPIENALEGAVTSTLDALSFTTNADIMGETVIDIHHCLLAAPGVKALDIKRIASHPQPVGQCRRYLQGHYPGIEIMPASSTADSVRAAVASTDTAGIGSRFAAEVYGAEVIDENIEDHYGNQTRFVLVGHGKVPRTGNDKTTLALFMQQDRSGVLNMILSEFAFAGINMTYVQSRPLKRALGEYMFFVDVEGHMDDASMRTALDCLRLKLREVRVLGSYPACPRDEE